MSYRALVLGVAGLVALAAAGLWGVITTIFGYDEEIDLDGDEFVEAYFAPGLIHGDD